MKRNKHILLNLTEDQYNCIKYIACKDNRKLSDAAYLLFIEILNDRILKYVDAGSTGFKPLKYNSDIDIDDVNIIFKK